MQADLYISMNSFQELESKCTLSLILEDIDQLLIDHQLEDIFLLKVVLFFTPICSIWDDLLRKESV